MKLIFPDYFSKPIHPVPAESVLPGDIEEMIDSAHLDAQPDITGKYHIEGDSFHLRNTDGFIHVTHEFGNSSETFYDTYSNLERSCAFKGWAKVESFKRDGTKEKFTLFLDDGKEFGLHQAFKTSSKGRIVFHGPEFSDQYPKLIRYPNSVVVAESNRALFINDTQGCFVEMKQKEDRTVIRLCYAHDHQSQDHIEAAFNKEGLATALKATSFSSGSRMHLSASENDFKAYIDFTGAFSQYCFRQGDVSGVGNISRAFRPIPSIDLCKSMLDLESVKEKLQQSLQLLRDTKEKLLPVQGRMPLRGMAP